MATPVYLLVLAKAIRKPGTQLSKAERDSLWAKVVEIDKRAGLKPHIACNSRWADEKVTCLGVGEVFRAWKPINRRSRSSKPWSGGATFTAPKRSWEQRWRCRTAAHSCTTRPARQLNGIVAWACGATVAFRGLAFVHPTPRTTPPLEQSGGGVLSNLSEPRS